MEQEYTSQRELIEIGIRWLSLYSHFRNDSPESSQGKALVYANTQSRVINRVKDELQTEAGLNWFHDFILKRNPDKIVFEIFFKLWSTYYRIAHPLEIEDATISESREFEREYFPNTKIRVDF